MYIVTLLMDFNEVKCTCTYLNLETLHVFLLVGRDMLPHCLTGQIFFSPARKTKENQYKMKSKSIYKSTDKMKFYI